MSNIADGAVVTFLCRGFYEGNRFLNGLTDAPVFGGVDLEIIPGLQSLNICAGGYATSPGEIEDGELPNYQRRRSRLIEHTLRRDGEDFVVAFQPEDTIVFRNGDPAALRKICGVLRWKIISDTALSVVDL